MTKTKSNTSTSPTMAVILTRKENTNFLVKLADTALLDLNDARGGADGRRQVLDKAPPMSPIPYTRDYGITPPTFWGLFIA